MVLPGLPAGVPAPSRRRAGHHRRAGHPRPAPLSGEVVHLIVRDAGEGWYATSPQAPGLAYGRSTLEELRADLGEVLAFHGDRPGPFTVIEHLEQHYDVAGGELVTRVALDNHRADQREVHTRITAAMTVPEQARSLVEQPTNRVGEVVYVCAVPTDTLGWLAAQLDPRGDAVVVALAIADPFVVTIPVARTGSDVTTPLVTVSARSSPAGTTLGEVAGTTPIVQPVRSERSLTA